MLQWAVTFLIIALIAGFFGFGSVVAISIGFARILFIVFITLFIVTTIMHILRGKTPTI